MKYQKAFFAILILDLLMIIFLAVLSSRFLIGELNKIKKTDPEILAQYETNLEVDRFLNLLRQVQLR
ncbi:MAG TPA: hypothetical protein VMW41_00310 [Candidatus Bathyarchaeia archaeon]|nr:hypothetical protein [Candidatus Bathyarchaeia archaeon]